MTSSFAYDVVILTIEGKIKKQYGEEIPSENQIVELLDLTFENLKKDVLSDYLSNDDKPKIKTLLMARNKTRIETSNMISSEQKQVDLIEKNPPKKTPVWNAYKKYLNEKKRIPPQVVDKIGENMDRVFGKLGNPKSKNPFGIKGLVMGDVQSGKTTAYCALITKAYDAGYRNFIITTGITEDLRMQTQQRIEESFIGRDSRDHDIVTSSDNYYSSTKSTLLYINTLQKTEKVKHDLSENNLGGTNSNNQGDFSKRTLRNIMQPPLEHSNQNYRVLVTKKNKSMLENLLKWSFSNEGAYIEKNGKQIVHNRPLLFIDDESDLASKNTNTDPEDDPSTINKLMRKLVSSYDQCSFVSFTATPWADVFSDASPEKNDLFPKNFIVNLKPPNNYFGPSKLFGIYADYNSGEVVSAKHNDTDDDDYESFGQLPLLNILDENETNCWLKTGHDKYTHPRKENFPKSLENAIKNFILNIIIKKQRGLDSHNSMLVHCSQYIEIHEDISYQIKEYLSEIRQKIQADAPYNDTGIFNDFEEIYDEIKKINEEFVDIYDDRSNTAYSIDIHNKETYKLPSWSKIKKEIPETIENLANLNSETVVVLNSKTKKDVINFSNPEYDAPGKYLNKIYIGGYKLSRGLTLEGLSVSYFTRIAKSPLTDTILQMGRWFGYRPGYLDICRLYTSSDIIEHYKDFTYSSEELRIKFEQMWTDKKTPLEFSLAVSTHPNSDLTNRLKMSNAQETKPGYHDYPWITCSKYIYDEQKYINDKEVFEKYISSQSDYQKSKIPEDKGALLWKKVPKSQIVNFFRELSKPKIESILHDPEKISEWINNQKEGMLEYWTVALMSRPNNQRTRLKGPADVTFKHIDEKVRLRTRENQKNHDYLKSNFIEISNTGGFNKKDYLIDLTEKQRKYCEDKNMPGNRTSKAATKRRENGTNGLLVLYPVIYLDPNNQKEPINMNVSLVWGLGLPDFNEDEKIGQKKVENVTVKEALRKKQEEY